MVGVASNLLDTSVVQEGPWNIFSALDSVGELIESDKLAAFPSLHAAYVVLFCYFTLRLKRSYGVISVPVTVGVLFSTIYLGQHFIIDLVTGRWWQEAVFCWSAGDWNTDELSNASV